MKTQEWAYDLKQLNFSNEQIERLLQMLEKQEFQYLLACMKKQRKHQVQQVRACSCQIDLCDDLIYEIQQQMDLERKKSNESRKKLG